MGLFRGKTNSGLQEKCQPPTPEQRFTIVQVGAAADLQTCSGAGAPRDACSAGLLKGAGRQRARLEGGKQQAWGCAEQQLLAKLGLECENCFISFFFS